MRSPLRPLGLALGLLLAACTAEINQATNRPGSSTKPNEPSDDGDDSSPNEGTDGPARSRTPKRRGDTTPLEETPPIVEATSDDIFKGLPHGQAQLAVICSRGGQNKVTSAFCSPGAKMPSSIGELASAIGLGFTQPNRTGRNNNGAPGNPGFVLTGHSSSLVARFTSAINPRAILFSVSNAAQAEFVTLGFVRGEQFAEIAARDSATNQIRFFLVVFEQACNATRSCTPGELETPAVEKNWTGFTLYEDVDIKNTVADCLQCHQPGGTNTAKLLRMQELRNPWTHFFRNNTPGGQALLADFHAAHGSTEDYGPIPAQQIDSSEPANLEDFVRANGFSNQPNEFPTGNIEREVRTAAPSQPASNQTPGTSPTWQRLYDAATAGQFIPPPYHDVKVTDPAKLAQATQAYTAFRTGVLPAASLPDFRSTIFLESRMWAMGFAAKPGLDGRQLLVQACQQCHHPALDQTITRARFDVVNLARMSREEKDRAIERLRLPGTDPLKMPPERFRTLTAAEVDLMVAELRK